MKRIIIFLISTIIMTSSCSKFQRNTPEAVKKPKQFEEFGNTRTDNYYWMNNRKDPEVQPGATSGNPSSSFTKRLPIPSMKTTKMSGL